MSGKQSVTSQPISRRPRAVISQRFARRLRHWMAGRTQADAAHSLGVTDKTLRAWLAGRLPPQGRIPKVARILRCRAAELHPSTKAA